MQVNPQRPQLFTWLSAIATRFEMYKFERLVFHYKPSCSTTTSGWVALGFDFDAYDAIPDKSAMLAWKYSTKCSPWQSCTLDVSQDSRISTYRFADYGSRGDIRLDFLGHVVALAYSPTTAFVGELMVSYTVRFRQPSYKLPPVLYQTMEGSPMQTSNEFFAREGETTSALLQNTGNVYYNILSKNAIRLYDVGKFLVTAAITADSSVASNLTVAYTAPAPTSMGTNVLVDRVHNATAAMAQYVVESLIPPIDLTFTGSTGLGVVPSVRIATFKS
jgi:hypothetical protein